MARAVEIMTGSSRRIAAASLIIAAAPASTLFADRAASAEPTAPTVSARDESASEPFAAFIAEGAQRFGVPASWIRALIQVESGGDVHALSPKGAMGLMQIMPETWTGLRLRYDLGADPFDAHDSILAGAAYLRELHDRYGDRGFLAAYNAGPARYDDHLATARPLPAETNAYVAMLAPMLGDDHVDDAMIVAVAARSWTEAPLFAVRPESSRANPEQTADVHTSDHSIDGAGKDLTALAPQSAGLFIATSRRNPQ
jgi:soluble lytic murein transglycosylase-like protein